MKAGFTPAGNGCNYLRNAWFCGQGPCIVGDMTTKEQKRSEKRHGIEKLPRSFFPAFFWFSGSETATKKLKREAITQAFFSTRAQEKILEPFLRRQNFSLLEGDVRKKCQGRENFPGRTFHIRAGGRKKIKNLISHIMAG